jgi:hypothetical protein
MFIRDLHIIFSARNTNCRQGIRNLTFPVLGAYEFRRAEGRRRKRTLPSLPMYRKEFEFRGRAFRTAIQFAFVYDL